MASLKAFLVVALVAMVIAACLDEATAHSKKKPHSKAGSHGKKSAHSKGGKSRSRQSESNDSAGGGSDAGGGPDAGGGGPGSTMAYMIADLEAGKCVMGVKAVACEGDDCMLIGDSKYQIVTCDTNQPTAVGKALVGISRMAHTAEQMVERVASRASEMLNDDKLI